MDLDGVVGCLLCGDGMTLFDLVTKAVAESTDDLMMGLRCRCGCNGVPATDHYMPSVALEALEALGESDDED